jgi:hypothetical protein
MYIQHISITIHILLPTTLPFSWAGWLSSTPSVRYNNRLWFLDRIVRDGAESKNKLMGVMVYF